MPLVLISRPTARVTSVALAAQEMSAANLYPHSCAYFCSCLRTLERDKPPWAPSAKANYFRDFQAGNGHTKSLAADSNGQTVTYCWS